MWIENANGPLSDHLMLVQNFRRVALIKNTMSVKLCTEVTFAKNYSCLIARIISFDTSGLHLHIFRILEPYPTKDIELDPSGVISH